MKKTYKSLSIHYSKFTTWDSGLGTQD